VVGVVAVEDAGAVRRLAGELDGRLDRLGARIAEEDTLDALVRTVDEGFGENARQEGAVDLDEVREVGVDGVVERLFDHRVAAPRAKTPKPESRSR